MKKLFTYLFLLVFVGFEAQVLVTKFPLPTGTSNIPHESAMLELRSSNQGILFPTVALLGTTDQVTVLNPVEGTVVLNTSVNSSNSSIPTSKPTLAVWDGTQWLFTFNKENVLLDLDKVRNYTAQNTTSVSFGTFPASNPNFAMGDNTTNWGILINSNTSAQQPAFEFDYDKAEQRIVVDVEGMATVTDANFSYAIGIFVDDKLVSAKKFYQTALTPTCYFQKFNLRALLTEQIPNSPTQILNKAAGQVYNIKVGVRPLQKETGETSTSLTFGNASGTCNNVNADTARTYINIFTIEKKDL